MSEFSQLKSCPFCLSDAFISSDLDRLDNPIVSVECNNNKCNSSSKKIKFEIRVRNMEETVNNYFYAKQAAIESWNNRNG